jgi:hypothetical protein
MAYGRGWIYWASVALSAAALLFVVLNAILSEGNRSIQVEVNQRQQYINQSIQFGRVNEALIRSLAQTAVSDKDNKLRELLAQQGITINETGTTSTPLVPNAGATSGAAATNAGATSAAPSSTAGAPLKPGTRP